MNLSDLVQGKPSPHPDLGPDCVRHPFQLASQCRECRKDAQLLWGARQLVDKRVQRRHELMQAELAVHAGAIQADTEAIAQRMAREYAESYDTQLKARNEALTPYVDRASDDVYQQMLAEAIAELRGKE